MNRSVAPSILAHYFSNAFEDVVDRHIRLCRAVLSCCSTHPGSNPLLSSLSIVRGKPVVYLDGVELEKLKIDELSAELSAHPDDTIRCLAAATHQACDGGSDGSLLDADVTVRLFNCPAFSVQISSIGAARIGKLVSVTGTVSRMSAVASLIMSMDCVCKQCGWRIRREFTKCSSTPTCERPRCKSRHFIPDTASIRRGDWQQIVIRQDICASQQISGGVGNSMIAVLKDDLVHGCVLGDAVTVVGIVRTVGQAASKNRPPPQPCNPFTLFVDALSVAQTEPQRLPFSHLGMPDHLSRSFSHRDIKMIHAFRRDCAGRVLKHLVHAFCPQVCGHEAIKAGLLLSLMDGCSNEKTKQIEGHCAETTHLHVLLVGDPGMQTTELLQVINLTPSTPFFMLLQEAARWAPKSVYITGGQCSKNNLTVSCTKEDTSGCWMFEAGPIVLAKNGLCCIEGFDELASSRLLSLTDIMDNHANLTEDRGGAILSTSVPVNIIATTGPSYGHYQYSKTLVQNLRIDESIASRFGLIFLMTDRPDTERDRMLSRHMLKMQSRRHFKGTHSKGQLQRRMDLFSSVDEMSKCSGFIEQLQLPASLRKSTMPTDFLKKYVAYAKKHVHPQLSNEAMDTLEKFYLHLRSQLTVSSEIPVTARNLQMLISLAKACARIELRESVTVSDAENAIRLVNHVICSRIVNAPGPTDDLPLNRRKRKAKQIEIFIQELRQHALSKDTDLVTMNDIYLVADDLELDVEDIQDFVDKLNDEGELLKKGPQLYRVLGTQNATLQNSNPNGEARRLTGRGFSVLSRPEL